MNMYVSRAMQWVRGDRTSWGTATSEKPETGHPACSPSADDHREAEEATDIQRKSPCE